MSLKDNEPRITGWQSVRPWLEVIELQHKLEPRLGESGVVVNSDIVKISNAIVKKRRQGEDSKTLEDPDM